MISRLMRALIGLLALGLAGCASVIPLPDRPPAAAIEQFAFSGRLTLRQGDIRHHAQIDWHHEAARDEILLTTPLGQGVAEIVRDATGAHLLLADRRRFTAADWSELSAEVFGFRLPLQNSARWLLGDSTATAGWHITVIERESAAPHALPIRIELERDDIAVHLRIDEWRTVQ